MKTISNVVINPTTNTEVSATERVLSKHGFNYEMIEDVTGEECAFEVYEELTPQNWAEILEEIEQEVSAIEAV